MKPGFVITALLAASLISACGGGGSSSPAPLANTPTPNVPTEPETPTPEPPADRPANVSALADYGTVLNILPPARMISAGSAACRRHPRSWGSGRHPAG